MGVDVDKVERRMDKHKADKERKGGSYFGVPPDKSRFPYFCPPHPNMNGLPWSERMVHKRELPKDTKAAYDITCQRDNYDQDVNKCPDCIIMQSERDKKKVKGDEHDERAGQYAPRRKPISQVMDFTPLFNKRGEPVKKLRKCFLQHGEYDKCESCFLKEQCKRGVQRYNMPVGVWEELGDHIVEEGDVTDPKAALCIRVKRTGSGKNTTRYRTKIAKETIKIPAEVVARMNEKIVDLTTIDPKPEGTMKELKKIYADFHALADVGDEEDGDSLPKCFQKYDEKKKKKRGCKKCKVREECIDAEDDDDDEPVRKPKPKKKSNASKLDKVRSNLKKKSKKGKNDR